MNFLSSADLKQFVHWAMS